MRISYPQLTVRCSILATIGISIYRQTNVCTLKRNLRKIPWLEKYSYFLNHEYH